MIFRNFVLCFALVGLSHCYAADEIKKLQHPLTLNNLENCMEAHLPGDFPNYTWQAVIYVYGVCSGECCQNVKNSL
jgi:hypothetical protein